jgi:HEPN domain-containing protein
MTPFIEEALRLLRIAERDYQTLGILLSHPDSPRASTCFHAQQCVEKALKAVLSARQVFFRRTHDLEEITNLLTEAGATPPFTVDDYRRLSPYAVEMRYDDQVIPLLTLEEATEMAAQTLAWASAVVARQEQ